MHAARDNWIAMRAGWVSIEAASAHAYEQDFLRFQLYTENGFYVVAEHLVRYRAVLHKAGEDIHELMSAMVRMCPKPAPPGEGTFNLMSVLVTGIVAVTTTVITGGSGTRQYIEAVDKIERDAAEAIQNLRDSLRRELDALRSDRR